MPKVIFIAHDGNRSEIDAPDGVSLMSVAVNNGVAGIDGDCGGQCACATCHVFVDGEWGAILPPPSTMESEMLGFAAETTPQSRLACQIHMSASLDGLTVRMPEGQH